MHDPRSSKPFDVLSLAAAFRSMTDDEILLVGSIPPALIAFWPDIQTQRLIIIGERRRHILASHPELLGHEVSILRTLFDPMAVHRNKSDARIAIFYREVDSERLMRLPVWMSNRPDRDNSLLSARFAKWKEFYVGRKEGRQVWRKG